MGSLIGRGRLKVSVGVADRQPAPGAAVPLVFVALQDGARPSPGEAAPRARVRAPRPGRDGIWLEQLRFDSRADLRALPGLDAPGLDRSQPSGLRDAVRLALAAGATFCDVLLVGVPDASPWELHRAELMDAVAPALDGLHGAAFAAPDLLGPPVLGPADPLSPAEREALAHRNLRALAPGLRGRHQLGLFDAPGDDLAAAEAAGSADVALVGWEGSPEDRVAHGWRSAAALVAGVLARADHPMIHGVDGARMTLPPGRPRPSARRARLAGSRPVGPVGRDVESLRISAHLDGDQVILSGDATLRRPLPTWPLAALRTASIIHLRLLRAAEAFVFRPVQPIHAFALGLALEQVMRPLAEAGVVVGPQGAGAPSIRATVLPDRGAPGFVAEVRGELRPWCRVVDLRVAVSADGAVVQAAAPAALAGR